MIDKIITAIDLAGQTLNSLGADLPALLFYIFAAVAIGGALTLLIKRNPITCAIGVVVSLFSIAFLFFLLSAHFIGALQVIVYAGAIMVLFLFVIMLLNLTDKELGKIRFSSIKATGACVFLACMYMVITEVAPAVNQELPMLQDPEYGTVSDVAKTLFTKYVLAFELTSILILSAIISAVILAKDNLEPKKFFSLFDWILEKMK